MAWPVLRRRRPGPWDRGVVSSAGAAAAAAALVSTCISSICAGSATCARRRRGWWAEGVPVTSSAGAGAAPWVSTWLRPESPPMFFRMSSGRAVTPGCDGTTAGAVATTVSAGMLTGAGAGDAATVSAMAAMDSGADTGTGAGAATGMGAAASAAGVISLVEGSAGLCWFGRSRRSPRSPPRPSPPRRRRDRPLSRCPSSPP
jgi:hypothetical protein